MAISIRKREMPTITLTGKVIDSKTGIIAASASEHKFSSADNDIIVNVSARSVRKKEVPMFFREVQIDVEPPYGAYSYPNWTMVGSAMTERHNIVGQHCEVYGTFNGKDPSRTKRHLWKNRPVFVRFNTSGSDNVVLKTRTYYRGELSDILTINFRVVGRVGDAINNS